ncbi:MAG: hypothetical protein PF480_11535 [Roseovarius sp.]|jgi:predicted membrane chloride channel (bestrophin family)|nr:hypothetical protein [Roseovarius sp.]
MALRKQTSQRTEVRDDLQAMIKKTRLKRVTEDELHEQRISFAFGNAMSNEKITKDSVRTTAQRVRLKA